MGKHQKRKYAEHLQVLNMPVPQLRIAELDMDAHLDGQEYKRRKLDLEYDLLRLQGKVVEQGIPVLIIMEGLDAAGKGGAIKRLTNYLDPRWVRVHNLSRPSAGERSSHWLRRYWLRLPRRGRITIFDDYSWYARLMVERIEGLVSEEDAQRSIGEIVELERSLAAEGYCIIKIWPHVSREEQLRRFESRKADPLRSWKLTPDDWANNKMYDRYSEAAEAAFDQTNTPYAPWFLVPADDKRYARISIMETVVRVLERWPALPA